jgi:hypothetical protein
VFKKPVARTRRDRRVLEDCRKVQVGAVENLQKKAPLYDLIHRLEEKLKDSGFAIQGELVGPGVQCNRLSLKEMELHVFNVIKLGNRKAVSHDDAVKFCASIGVPMVHFVESGNAFSYTMKQLLDLSKGKYKGTKNDREG